MEWVELQFYFGTYQLVDGTFETTTNFYFFLNGQN